MITPQKRLEIVNSLKKNQKSTTEFCKENNISRDTLYRWLKETNIKDNYLRGEDNPNSIYPKIKKSVIRLITKDPSLSCRQISSILKSHGKSISHVQVNSLLNKIGAETHDRRLSFANNYQGPGRLKNDVRTEVVNKYTKEHQSISSLSHEYNISRDTIYRWISKDANGLGLEDKYARGEAHPNAIYPSLTPSVLKVVGQNPTMSADKIAKVVNSSVWTVWKILDSHNLNFTYQRVAFAQKQKPVAEEVFGSEVARRTNSVFETFTPNTAPAPPPAAASVFKTFLSFFFGTSLLASVTVIWWNFVFSQAGDISQFVGLIFATLALFMGSVFFLYSLKYYISLGIVLSYSNKDDGKFTKNITFKNILARILGIDTDLELRKNNAFGLTPSLENVVLKDKPFVSVQIPFYNEKNVVSRSIQAAVNFNYPNYEIILADDSTDETTNIIKEYQKACLFKYEKLKETQGDGYTMTEVEVKPGVVLKHIHRTTRSGFKGAALDLALKLANPKTEYVSVFDADFVPYPDTLELFLKYFQISNDTDQSISNANNPIAAVQGYQWHVLNKSENWITRGVRSEYSGSYVIERSSAEIYGGLKQISGSVYMINKTALKEIGWGTSITEDFELTLKLYEKGYKVLYTPYIQAPSECVSTIKRLVRQRMRWAEGHSFNIKKMFIRLMFGYKDENGTYVASKLSFAEKLELLYLSPYYLQALFFLLGSLGWVVSEVVLGVRIPFWTEVWGWSLVLTNMISLPLLNASGLFLEESDSKDYSGMSSFVLLSYILVPFQAYAALKGFLEKEEGPWFRTPKTGKVTDLFRRGKFYHWLIGVVNQGSQSNIGPVNNYSVSHQKTYKRSTKRLVGNAAVALGLVVVMLFNTGAQYVQFVNAAGPTLKTPTSGNLNPGKLDKPQPEKTDDVLKEVNQSQLFSYETPAGTVDEILYKDPMFRIKNKGTEIQFALTSMSGQEKDPNSKAIRNGNSVIYKDVFDTTDIHLTANSGYVSESLILNEKTSFEDIEYAVKVVGVTPTEINGSILFVDDTTGETIYKLSPPYMYEANKGANNGMNVGLDELQSSDIKYSLGITYNLKKSPAGWVLKKELTQEGKSWISDPNRAFPVVIDPSVVVSGGIVDADTNYGGLQRKVAYVNGNWYAFHSDGSDVSYRKSSDGLSWGGDVDIDTGDADNHNPSIWVKENVIWVAWADVSSHSLEFRSIDTAASDALGTLTTCHDLGANFSDSHTTTIAVQETGTDIFAAVTDTDGGSGAADIWHVTSVGTCTTTQSIVSGSGLTGDDRPVLVAEGNDMIMVFQDGNLSYSHWSSSDSSWSNANSTISTATDNIYSVVSDGTVTWILSQSGTTDTNFYSISKIQSTIDSNLAANRSYVDIVCPTSGDCKIVYYDPSTAILNFLDCTDTSCSGTPVSIDTNGGSPHRGVPVSIDCSAGATDCKVVEGRRPVSAYTRAAFIDCNAADCSTTGTVQTLNSQGDDLPMYNDIWCISSTDCKWVFIDSVDNDLHFVDCADTNCTSTGRTDTVIDADVGQFGGSVSLFCPAADNCKVVYYDSNGSGNIIFSDCANATCSSDTETVIDSDVGIIDTAYVDVDCADGPTECRALYYDGTDDDVTFYDCNASETCASGAATDIDTTAGEQGSPLNLDCNDGTGPDDCKIVYFDGTDEDITFVDCNDDTCSSPTFTDLDTTAGLDSAFVSLDCSLGVADCQVVYQNGIDQEIIYINCNDADCDTPDAVTVIDSDVSAGFPYMDMDCPAEDNCKIVYQDVPQGDIVFADCNDATCSAPTLTDIDTSVGRQGSDVSIDCPTSDDCKVTYWDFLASTLYFVDCNSESCGSTTISALDATTRRYAPSAVDCSQGASDCKVVYYDEDEGVNNNDIVFIDCEDGDCSAPTTTTSIDTSAVGGSVDMDCSIAADNCKVIYSDAGSAIFYDCNGVGCATATTPATINSAISTFNAYGISIDCVGGDTDCKVFLYDVNGGDSTFYDCSSATCNTVDATTDLDTNIGNTLINKVSDLDCPTADNCKLLYSDSLDLSLIFVDCDNAACASGSRNHYTLSTAEVTIGTAGQINCPAADNCKVVFIDSVTPSMDFIDCVSEKCVVNTLTSPWTSETNILGISISYDSSNSDLIAHIIKDATEQAYFKSTDASTISWSSETSYGFTTGDINNLSSSYSGAGTAEIGVVVRQGANFEFAPVPESWWWLTLGTLIAILFINKRRNINYIPWK